MLLSSLPFSHDPARLFLFFLLLPLGLGTYEGKLVSTWSCEDTYDVSVAEDTLYTLSTPDFLPFFAKMLREK